MRFLPRLIRKLGFVRIVSYLMAIALLLPLATSAAVKIHTQQEFEKTIASSQYNKESFDLQSYHDILSGITTLLIGCVYEDCPGITAGGAIGTAVVASTSLYMNQPASGIEYMADVGQKLQLVKPAYAQTGLGFNRLSPLLPLWRAFRNVSYLLFSVAIVIIGFAILFRLHISPQTVITIQSALPRIIIALVLVTFSYAIVGFMIDLIYIIFSLIINGIVAFGGMDSGLGSATITSFQEAGFNDVFGAEGFKLALKQVLDILAGGILPGS